MRPLIIGIAGGSGSGKTTIAQKVRTSIAAIPQSDDPGESTPTSAALSERVTIIEHDAYYRDRADLTYEERTHLNFDHPDSLETSL
jgi:uridine kinase